MAQPAEDTPPEVAILSNEAALHALKRPQLVSLAKVFGVKASGKNVEIIARLQEHGHWITQHTGTDEDTLEEGDASTASWAVVKDQRTSTGSAELVLGGPSTSSTSGTSVSYASESLKSTTSTLRAKSLAEGKDFAAHADTSADQDFSMDTSMGDEDGIRMVSSRTTVCGGTSEAGDDPAPLLPALPMSPPAFVFGSPPPATHAPASTSAFTFSMPGALFASTSSTASEATAAPAPDSTDAGKSAAEQIMEEMNRRAAEARAAAEADGLTRSRSTLFETGKSKGTTASPEKGSKQAFDVHHKRNFAKMDSITNHWAAKRPHPSTSTSSGNIAGMARSTSSRTLTASTSTERPNKRLKASSSISSTLNRLPSSTSNRNLVNALRDEGWSAAPVASTSVSLSASVRSGTASVRPRPKEMREDLKPAAEREREHRRRQLELAKARRKSQAGTGVGLPRRRPSLGVGPKPPSFSAGGFLKKTFRKLASTPAPPTAPPTPRPPLPSSSSIRRLAADRPTKPLPSPARTPRFAAPTASTSARALSSAMKPAAASPSPKKQPGWKKFDLQESLRRPMAWKTGPGGSSPAVVRAGGAGVNRQVSARVANPSMLGHVKAPAGQSEASSDTSSLSVAPNASLSHPSAAPTASTPFAPLTNLAPNPSFLSTSTTEDSSSPWQPPAITKRPTLPLSSPAKKSASTTVSRRKKVVSSSSRLARAGEKGKGRAMADEVESRARKVRATKEARTRLKVGEGKK